MNLKSYPIGIHLNENSVKMLDGIVQFDDGNLFQVQLYNGTEAFDFTGFALINVTIINPDESVLTDSFVEDTEKGSHTYLAIQYLDAENGRITLKVGGYAVTQVGLHRMAIEIYSDDGKVTTARINYNVVETLDQADESILTSNESYTALQALLAQCADIIQAEQERVNQDAARAQASTERDAQATALISELRSEIDYAYALFNDAVAQGQMDALTEHLEEYIDARVGILPTTEDVPAYFQGDQRVGAMVYSPDDELVYVGKGEGAYMPVITYLPYVASSDAPADTRSLWIDTSGGYVVKYYNGNQWMTTKAIALFA